MRAFQKAMPNVHVKLHYWSNEQIAVGLRDGRLKVALIARALERGPFRDFRFEELLREHVRLAVPPNHPFARRRSVSLADAAQEPFVGLTREDFSDYHRYLASLFASEKNVPDQGERCGRSCRRYTSSASTSMRFPQLSPRTGRVSGRPGSPKRASAPAPKGLRRKTSCPRDAARYVHPRLRCGRRRRSSGSWPAASETFHQRPERARRCKPVRRRDRRFRRR